MDRYGYSRLLALAGLIFSTTTYGVENDVRHFQLSLDDAGHQCIGLVPASSDNEELRVTAISCADERVPFWLKGEGHTLVLARDGQASEQCLTRKKSAGLNSLLVTACYEGDNDVQSWGFNSAGELLTFSRNQAGGVFKQGAESVRGSFQWLKSDGTRSEWCYVRPWGDNNCSRICGRITQEEQCVASNQDDGASANPSPDESTFEGNPSLGGVNGQSQTGKPVIVKHARWFTLKQQRLDDNICMGYKRAQGLDAFGASTSFYQVELQTCAPGQDKQRWGHDLIKKTIYNKELANMCLTRTNIGDVRLAACYDEGEINNSQRWYFGRGNSTDWGALTAFGARQWEHLLPQESSRGIYTIRPSYGADCERVRGRCYDLVTGILQQHVPFYTN